MCPRIFKSEGKFTLHVYCHTLKEHQRDDNPDDPMEEDDSSEDEENSEVQFKFVASTGWVIIFLIRNNLGHYKMKGEKGSADYDAIEPWISEWLTFLHAELS